LQNKGKRKRESRLKMVQNRIKKGGGRERGGRERGGKSPGLGGVPVKLLKALEKR
jgi:hypothetical protein